jgi:hypothetical protein
MNSEKVRSPRPPAWMSPRITSCPKRVNSVPVSRTARPVTQVALVAVNRASIQPMDRSGGVAAGSFRSAVPRRMSTRKLPISILRGPGPVARMARVYPALLLTPSGRC